MDSLIWPPLDFDDEPTQPQPLMAERAPELTVEELIWIVNAQYPRIGKQIELFWGHPEMEDKFSEWLVDRRGNRKGFSPETTSALVSLSKIHGEAFTFEEKKTWVGELVDTKFSSAFWDKNSLKKLCTFCRLSDIIILLN